MFVLPCFAKRERQDWAQSFWPSTASQFLNSKWSLARFCRPPRHILGCSGNGASEEAAGAGAMTVKHPPCDVSPLNSPMAVFTRSHRARAESAPVNNVAVTRTRSCGKPRLGRGLLRSGRLEDKSDDGLGSDRLPIESGCLKTPLLQRV